MRTDRCTKSIRKEIQLAKDPTATYCCPHRFSFRRCIHAVTYAPGSNRPSTTSPSPHGKSHDPRCQYIWPVWSLTTSTRFNSCTKSRENLAIGEECSRSSVGGWGSVSLPLDAAFTESVACISCLLSLVQPHLLHSSIRCSRQLVHSCLWLPCSLPTVSIHSNPFNK